ncbi:transcription factor DIVARICATA, partial [Haematococcus lacustris]
MPSSGSGVFAQTSFVPCDWSPEENKAFEVALAQHYHDQENRWHKIAASVPGRTAQEEDLQRIDSGLVPLPDYSECLYLPESQPRERLGPGSGQQKASAPVPKKTRVDTAGTDRRKGVPWTEEEHRLFLIGLSQFGKGDWRSIARNYVVSRTPTQVASHAQKYFIRLNSANKKDKRRASIHDITSSTVI